MSLKDQLELKDAREMYGNVRPMHKKRLAMERLNAEQNKKHPEPMSLMRKREKELDKQFSSVNAAGERVEHLEMRRKPEVTAGRVEKAATAYAKWDLNDPFAYGRTALHARQGFINPEETAKEFTMRTVARKAARVKEVDDAKLV